MSDGPLDNTSYWCCRTDRYRRRPGSAAKAHESGSTGCTSAVDVVVDR